MIESTAAARFRQLGILAIFAVYCVILAGGIVRASGAGMGCPDWPTCFGQLIPPTDEAQLPANYHEIYAARGYQNTTFNPLKTWTEYSNRLIGATTGLLVLLTAWSSRKYLKDDKGIFYLSVLVLLLIGFQGWLGSAVVASNLKPLMITLHMLLALFIVALLIYAIARSQKPALQNLPWSGPSSPRFDLVLKIAMAMTLFQVAMGTQVREAVDFIANGQTGLGREYWRESFPLIFYVHRSFSSLILFTNLWLGWKLISQADTPALIRNIAYSVSGLIVTAILAGVSLDRLGFPAIAQPVHLLMANLIFGGQFFLFICIEYSKPANTN